MCHFLFQEFLSDNINFSAKDTTKVLKDGVESII